MLERLCGTVGTDAAGNRDSRGGTKSDIPGGAVVGAVGAEIGTGINRQDIGAVELNGITAAVGAIRDLGLEHGIDIDGNKAGSRFGMDPVSGVVVEGDAGGSGDLDTAGARSDVDVTVVGVRAGTVGNGLGDCQMFRVRN